MATARPRLWQSFDHPAIWLAYLPLFFIPWFIRQPSPAQMLLACAGLGLFLIVYFAAINATGWRLVALATTCLMLSFALAFTGSNWTVISIYAAATVAWLRPAWRAAFAVGLFAAASTGLALATGQPPLYWVLGVLLMLMVGIGNISRAAVQEKNRELAAAQEEVRHFAAAAERERIGRDLHDLLGRTLTLIAIKADLAARLSAAAPDKAAAEMRDVAAAAREGLVEVRAAVSGMTGASLAHEIGASQAALTAAGIACQVDGDADRIDPGTSAVLAMALREAVTNVIRHSGARTCRIALVQQPGGLELRVSDDGDGQAVRPGGGIAGLTARLSAAGGDLAVEGDAQGTRLTARLPLGRAA
ncbi:two-component sensor histidine kinase [Sphingomonas changnyeongensis]|uniref:Two-component sensor histidine kinase n=1 Tax=Sphingomonas changnyeongensis TaxID=2698679 RepID=A0A7Z2NW18_9SPHN|nr:sensor histidine kinase [Sphingomonas changnyeongensis]QHL90506.1 two-component sensor histidine kinase [Sphingomonas changnyeongensis]